MTWSLRIFNGDLVKGYNNNLDTVQGTEKVVQDLICWIRHPIGSDPLNPQLGSFIQNGSNGETYLVRNKMIVLPDDYSELVISEIGRIIEEYQASQSVRIENEIAQFGKIVNFTQDEVIKSFKINYIENYDTLYVLVDLQTISGLEFNINIPIQDNAIIRGI